MGASLGGNFSAGNIIAGLVFSGIGFVAMRYGKANGNFQMIGLGVALMAYPYFTPTTLWTCGVGAGLTAALYYARE